MDKFEVFKDVIAKYSDDPYPHLDEMNISELSQRRLRLSEQIKVLESERKYIDETLLDQLSEQELKIGIRVNPEYLLMMRNKSTWSYPEVATQEIYTIRKHYQELGEAYLSTTPYLVLRKT